MLQETLASAVSGSLCLALQMGKLRPREGKGLAQGHTTSPWQIPFQANSSEAPVGLLLGSRVGYSWAALWEWRLGSPGSGVTLKNTVSP